MTLIPLELPPGVSRPGTLYGSRGRWYDTNLVRWVDGVMQPWGGWDNLQEGSGPTDIDLAEPVRGMFSWLGGVAHLAMGTPTKLYHYSEGVLTDITPSGFQTGSSDAAEVSGAFGSGPFGSGLFGTGGSLSTTLVEAQTWQFDNFGEDLIAVAYSDGRLHYWDKSVGGVASALSGAPEFCRGVVVTPERFVVALGAEGDPRKIAWSDQEDATDWTPTVSNQAGDFTLAGPGEILAGRRSKKETLLWTDDGLYRMQYIGGTLVYSVKNVADHCGAIGPLAMAVADGKAFWMGHRGFFGYDGFVKAIPSEVSDYVFDDINRTQASKIAADVRSDFGEILWYYPSSGSDENDRYVSFNWRSGEWTIGQLERTSGIDRNPFDYPIAADASGAVYEHEKGTTYLDTDGATALTPYAESGPVEIGNGDRWMHVLRLIPDEATNGDVQLTAYTGDYPTESETTHGPFTTAQPTDVRFAGRLVRLKVEQVNTGWRYGGVRLEVRPGEMR